ncbi:Crp/Fnr family transcriptional regulator [Roseomonas terrae]|jgi:CRP/FNR family cyclic AMP-dependent transcriptional regulator|uniref:Crp/Fnr family transcriptional regulator n=1 Tax=Neoroseomonas terrae TaxID=424799 RepID=A0ABS5EAR7_9PROT|nr:Crp/Fnr family transcriptional regulator [Neoroseomonas terrae]MBR0648118.1 Crp/Fnr family transcriptional regulator [Neoroseomonas terrae]
MATLPPSPGGSPADAADTDRLRRLPILSHAAEDVLQRAARSVAWRTYAAGELIIDLQDTSHDVWFVVDGSVRVQVRTPSGRELILTDIGAGGMFGEIAAIDGKSRTASATALLRSRLCAIPAAVFLEVSCSAPATCHAVLTHMAAILRRQSKRLLERDALPVRLRLQAELLRLSRPRSGSARSAEERVVSPPPRQHVLAGLVGTRREAISRELAELVRQGTILRERGAIVIRRPGAMRAALEAELDAELGF